MAKAYPAGSQGAVAHAAGSATDFVSFDINETQATESVAAYGVGVYDPHRGSGTPHSQVTVAGFAAYGATNTPPGFGSTSSGMASPTGGTATYTIATGVTYAGPYVMANLKLSHSRIRAAVPVAFTMENSGDVTTTWPVS
jgi:hypothetical protein